MSEVGSIEPWLPTAMAALLFTPTRIVVALLGPRRTAQKRPDPKSSESRSANWRTLTGLVGSQTGPKPWKLQSAYPPPETAVRYVEIGVNGL